SRYRLRPEWFPQEYELMRSTLASVIAAKDPENGGEFLELLQSLGLTESDPVIRSAMDFFLSAQNPDGSWGDPKAKDIYARYHSTWTAIGGLMEYAWPGRGTPSEAALRLVIPEQERLKL